MGIAAEIAGVFFLFFSPLITSASPAVKLEHCDAKTRRLHSPGEGGRQPRRCEQEEREEEADDDDVVR